MRYNAHVHLYITPLYLLTLLIEHAWENDAYLGTKYIILEWINDIKNMFAALIVLLVSKLGIWDLPSNSPKLIYN